MGCSYNSENTNIFSMPKPIAKNDNAPVTEITFALTSSLAGNMDAEKEFYERNQGVFINVGGCEYLKKYLWALKQGLGDSLVLSHVGSVLSKDGKNNLSTVSCLSKIGYDFIAPSAYDVVNRKNLEYERLTKNFIVNNFLDLQTGKALNNHPFTSTMLLEKNGINVGVISIFDPELTQGQISANYINGVYIEDMVATILKEKNDLRNKGANIIVLALQNLSNCEGNVKSLEGAKAEQLICRFSDPLKSVLKKIPGGTIDIILSASPLMGNGFLAEVPVLQNIGKSKFISLAKLYFDTKEKKLLKNRSLVLPPLKVCHQYFEKTQDCYMKTTNECKFTNTRKDLIGVDPNLVTPSVLGISLDQF